MTLYAFLNEEQTDYLTYDESYDWYVSVCYIPVAVDDMDKYLVEMQKKVSVVGEDREPHVPSIQVNWSVFLQINNEKFQEFAEKHWEVNPSSIRKDRFDKLCLSKIKQTFTGNVPEDFYKTLYRFAQTLQSC